MTVSYSYVLIIIFSLKKAGKKLRYINYWVKHIKHLDFIGILSEIMQDGRFSSCIGLGGNLLGNTVYPHRCHHRLSLTSSFWLNHDHNSLICTLPSVSDEETKDLKCEVVCITLCSQQARRLMENQKSYLTCLFHELGSKLLRKGMWGKEASSGIRCSRGTIWRERLKIKVTLSSCDARVTPRRLMCHMIP